VDHGKHEDHHDATNATYRRNVGIVHVDIDDELHRDAKALAAQRGEPLKTLVTRAIEREVERLAKEQERRPGRRR
jgi:predicted HicB family RNase H-like nuclease